MISQKRNEVVVVWTTWPGETDPESFGRTLVEERLAACVTAHAGARSVYRWGENIEVAAEHQITIKTTAERVDELERRVRELHPYDVPEFLVLQTRGGSGAYLGWVAQSTGRSGAA